MSAKTNYNRSWYNKNKKPKLNLELIGRASNFQITPKFGYPGFSLYFPEEGDLDTEKMKKCTKSFENYINRNENDFNFASIESKHCIRVDYRSLMSEDEEVNKEWPDLQKDLINNTEFTLNCMGLAMHQVLTQASQENKKIDVIRARLINYEPVLQLKDLKVNNYGKLVSVRGTVLKASTDKILCQYLAFSCATCSGTQILKQIDGILQFPVKCQTEGCQARSNFQILHSSPLTRTVAFQSVKIQELIGIDESDSGRVPRSLECDLTEDLVYSCVPGDDVTIVGILKAQSQEVKSKNKVNSIFTLNIHVISVINEKNQSNGNLSSQIVTFSSNDRQAVRKIHEEPNLFRFLVQSLCPNIFGHDVVKAGLLLGMFGGTKCEGSRAESHILLVGDPGLGKSQMLRACTNVAPRGVYVCGNTSTTSGLTVTMTRENGGEYALEAGALLLADQGCCCIDEFDKMPTQHACLLEAMEQQSISIAKAGIVCSLPTRATILAAANPAGGHYNKSKTIAENLKISSPMLSRFDLIFIILDHPNEELDKYLSNHVLALHSGGKFNQETCNNFHNTLETQESLKQKLRLNPGEKLDYLPHSLFRKYIAYAQKFVSPKLSQEAKEVVKDFYISLRKQFQTGDSTPVTTRQLNSLIRLTQARAKCELREEATADDAREVVEIMKETLFEIFTDDVGVLDTTRSHSGTGMSTKNQVMKLLDLLQKKSEAETNSIFTTDEIRALSDQAGISKGRFFTVLSSLNIQGFILKKGGDQYQLVTADL